MKILAIFTFLVGFIGVGCAHSPFQGSVTERRTDEVIVHLTGKVPLVGQRIAFYERKCHSIMMGDAESCRTINIGQGEVTDPIGDHDAVVKLTSTTGEVNSGSWAKTVDVESDADRDASLRDAIEVIKSRKTTIN